ncbi:Spaetzle [Dermatophagoides farinae]|uniref:Spaetzle n=1 Tax=Dermatophagoides farinae TaxID=6954 RepID=A0A922LAT0_DERFA|nr:Spaetzle [Dermatophagoides farinae]
MTMIIRDSTLIIWWLATIFWIIIEIRSQSCGPRISPRLLKENVIPCDINTNGYCTEPGQAYPWSSMRRFIFENQGFVKKMYGEQRQSQIIHDELERLNNLYQDSSSRLSSASRRHSKQRQNFGKLNSNHNVDDDSNKTGDDRFQSKHSQATTTTTTTTIMMTATTDHYEQDLIINENQSITDNPIINESRSLSSSNESTNILVDNENIDDDDNNNNNNNIVIDDNVTDVEDENYDDDDYGGGGMTTTTTTTTTMTTVKGYNACPITQEVVAPYWANNTRGETLALLNVYPFEQYIHWEKCTNEYEQMFCRDGCRCEQQYRLHRLLAFDPKNECRGIFADWFRFPGCCVCICYDYYHDNDQQNQQHERINNRKARL